jgi:hypothetical protein
MRSRAPTVTADLGIQQVQLWVGDIDNANIASQNMPLEQKHGIFIL